MEARRVVLLSNHSILMNVVERLLVDADRIETFVVALDEPQWFSKLQALAPDAILIDTTARDSHRDIPCELLEALPGIQLISLNLQQPAIDVYSLKHLEQSDLAGLLAAIHGSYEQVAHNEPAHVVETGTKERGNGAWRHDGLDESQQI